MNSKLYDALKFVAQIALPGLGTLYFSLAGLWDFPNADAVVGTVVAVDTFLGLLLGLSSKAYNASDAKYDGAFTVATEIDGSKKVVLDLEKNPDALGTQKEILFKNDTL